MRIEDASIKTALTVRKAMKQAPSFHTARIALDNRR